MTTNTANYTPEFIKAAMLRNDAIGYKWLTRAIQAIWNFQTNDEQMTDETRHSNNVGFNGADANILSSFARQLQAGRNLSIKQLAIAKKKMPKYAKQLARIANGTNTER